MKSLRSCFYQAVSRLPGFGAEYLNDRFITAARRGRTEDVKALLAAGADVHAQDDKALLRAAQNGQTETVTVLLKAGADVHAGNDDALRFAQFRGYTETVGVLKDWRAREGNTSAPTVPQPGDELVSGPLTTQEPIHRICGGGTERREPR